MSKFFVLMACIGTTALVSGCAKTPSQRRYEESKRQLQQTIQKIESNKSRMRKIMSTLEVCRTKEADQKISAAAEANAVSAAMTANVQDTTYVTCDGKEINVGPITDESRGAVIISGPSVADQIFAVEVVSERTCAESESSSSVSDVTQTDDTLFLLESDGDIKLPLSNSNLKLGPAMKVTDGKNLLKLKYFKCETMTEESDANGNVKKVCTKRTLVGEKEMVLNVAITKEEIEGIRKVNTCEKKSKSDSKTADQE